MKQTCKSTIYDREIENDEFSILASPIVQFNFQLSILYL